MRQNNISWKLLVFLLLLLPSKAVFAQITPPANPCGKTITATAPLPPAFRFAKDPCNLTQDNLSGNFVYPDGTNYMDDYYGGEQFADYLDDWWITKFLPALRRMTKQLDVSRIDQTRQLGTKIDAENTAGA